MVRVLKRFIAGEQSHDNSVLTAITVDITKLPRMYSLLIYALGFECCHTYGTHYEVPF